MKQQFRAYIDYENNGQEPLVLSLYDNGNGADLVANDGIYSKYFTQFNGGERYSLNCRVSSKSQNFIFRLCFIR